ncbi:hypothetical protein DFP73DRAFT_487757 [Morchella snyderi]|nr:hypothetical protein DFP73DRAFT_487757 [Morchella snyderi]
MPALREGRARFTPGAFLLRILNALLRLFASPGSEGDTGKAPPTTGSTAPILENRPDFVPLTVPYLCVAAPYDYHELGFWDFPERAGWMPFDSLKLKCYRIDGGHASLSEQVAFLQAWLFFGVLAEISSICGLSLDIEAEFFAINDAEDGAKVISTAALNGLSRRWLEAAEDTAQASQPSRAARMIQVVRHAMSMQTRYVRPTKRESQSLLSYPQCMVLLSIRIVFRAVLLTLAMSGECEIAEIRSLMDPQVQQSFPAVWDELKDFSKDILLGNGWCRSECKLLERMDGAYETFAIGLTRRKMDHNGCNDFRCFADQVNEDVYKTVHVDAGCQCTSVVVDPEDLREVLGRGKIPRIIISKDCTQTTVSENHPYNAISHVCKLYISLSALAPLIL